MENPSLTAPPPVREGISTSGSVRADIVFGEDIAMVEATQAMAPCSIDQEHAVEVSVMADRAAIEGRRKVAALVAAEEALLKQKAS